MNNSAFLGVSETKQLVNNFLDSYLQQKTEESTKLNSRYGLLWKNITELVESGGKRFRPYMSVLSYQALGGEKPEEIIKIVASLELLHQALLIHDDIIDRDYIRYGTDNVAGKYLSIYASNLDDKEEVRHYSDSAAILAGDLLISGSYQLIVHNSADNLTKDLTKILDDAIFNVAGGELLDTESAFVDEHVSILTYELKTAHYTFVAPLLMGAVLAGASGSMKQSIKGLAITIGIAYQLVDDELGIFGDEGLTGKSSYGDIAEGKRTFMIEQFYEKASPEQKQKFGQYFAKHNLSREEASLVRQLIIDSGARQANLEKVEALKKEAYEIIERLDIGDQAKQGFGQLLQVTLERDS